MPPTGDGPAAVLAEPAFEGGPSGLSDPSADQSRFFAWGRAGYRWVVITWQGELGPATVREFATDLEEAAGVASDLLGLETRVRGVARAFDLWAEVATRADHVAYAWDVVVTLHPRPQES